MAYADTQNLFSEDSEEILRRAAAERTVRMNGFNQKEYNDIFKKETISDSAIEPATVASRRIKAEKEPSHILQPSAPLGFKKNGYLWSVDESQNLNPIIQPNGPRDGYILDPNDFGWGMMSAPPGGSYYQIGKAPTEAERAYQNIFSYMFEGVVNNLKDSMYRILTLSLFEVGRDFIMSELNKFGPTRVLTDYLGMFIDGGPLERIEIDWKDRLEFVVDSENRILAIRRYTDRQPNAFYEWLRKGVMKPGDPVIPYGGKPLVSVDELEWTNDGTVKALKKGTGGRLVRADEIEKIDPFYENSGTLNRLLHGDPARGIDIGAFRGNYSKRVISKIVNDTAAVGARYWVIGKDIFGNPVRVIAVPGGYTNVNVAIGADAIMLEIAGIANHKFFDKAEYVFNKFGLKKEVKRLHALEYERFGVPEQPPIYKGPA